MRAFLMLAVNVFFICAQYKCFGVIILSLLNSAILWLACINKVIIFVTIRVKSFIKRCE